MFVEPESELGPAPEVEPGTPLLFVAEPGELTDGLAEPAPGAVLLL